MVTCQYKDYYYDTTITVYNTGCIIDVRDCQWRGCGKDSEGKPYGRDCGGTRKIGRHGSRWAINEKQYGAVTDVLERERGRGNLSETGKEVLGKVMAIAAHAKGHAGELSPLGQRQHKGIAKRMFRRTPSLFSDSARVLVRSSVEPRCIVSMAAFSEGLKEENPSLRISRSASPGDSAAHLHDSSFLFLEGFEGDLVARTTNIVAVPSPLGIDALGEITIWDSDLSIGANEFITFKIEAVNTFGCQDIDSGD